MAVIIPPSHPNPKKRREGLLHNKPVQGFTVHRILNKSNPAVHETCT